MVENNGIVPSGITTSPQTITSTSAAGNVDLCPILVPTYIADLPIDPTTGTKTANTNCRDSGASYNTGYTISASNNRVTVSATGQITTSISATR
jgi:hypothetical protein